MNKKVLVVAFWCALALPMPSYAQADCSLCPELCDSVKKAREQYIQEDMKRQEETILEKVKKLAETSCLESLNDLNKSIDVGIFDPQSAGPAAAGALKDIVNEVCDKGVDFLNQQTDKLIGKVNDKIGTLPYGLGEGVTIRPKKEFEKPEVKYHSIDRPQISTPFP